MFAKLSKILFSAFLLVAIVFAVSSVSYADPNHLSKNDLGKVVLNLNTASQAEVARVLNALAGIDLCHKVLAYRLAHEGFKSIDELMKVEGMDEKIYVKIVKNVALQI